jgi:hypothetical protein
LIATHDGRKIAFADLAKLPKSLPAFDEPKPAPRPVITEERGAALLADLLSNEGRSVLDQARLHQPVLAETGWRAGSFNSAAARLVTRKQGSPAER